MANQTIEQNKNSENYSDKNKIATALQVIAWITYISGFLAGLIFASLEKHYEFIDGSQTEWSITIALIYWVSSFITGTIFLGFAEVITLLQKLVDKQNMTSLVATDSDVITHTEQFDDLPQL